MWKGYWQSLWFIVFCFNDKRLLQNGDMKIEVNCLKVSITQMAIIVTMW